MDQFLQIRGQRRLEGGRVRVAGSANQVTKCIIAALLTTDDVLIEGAPFVNERFIVEELFTALGGRVEHLDEHTLRLNARSVSRAELSRELCRRNRIAVLAVGPLLHRFRTVRFSAALGGDRIGARPVDFHVKGLEEMGAKVDFDGESYTLSVGDGGLRGTHLVLPFPSVMTTENLVMAATLAQGRTVIENAAIEPEIIELVRMLQTMGADIMVNANRTYVINGVRALGGAQARVMIDRNEAVSFACAALATGGDVLLEGVTHGPIYSFLNFIQRMGARFRVGPEGVFVAAPRDRRLRGTHVEVEVHPGFMTDWQQPFMALFTQAQGVSVLHETIFEDRLRYTAYLNAMGANISLFPSCLGEAPCRFKNRNHAHSAIVQGPTPLVARDFKLPTDIRAAFCLIVAGLVAEGVTHLSNVQEVQRKYDSLLVKFRAMGADIDLVEPPASLALVDPFAAPRAPTEVSAAATVSGR